MTSPWVDGEALNAAKMYARTTALVATLQSQVANRPAAASGSIVLTPTALNTPVTQVVTFPTGRFATAPAVVVTVAGGNAAPWSAGVASPPSSTAATLTLTQTSGTVGGRTVYWVAVEST